jgi:hypothetical protein
MQFGAVHMAWSGGRKGVGPVVVVFSGLPGSGSRRLKSSLNKAAEREDNELTRRVVTGEGGGKTGRVLQGYSN